MALLFINACFRENSRTLELARHYVKKYAGAVTEVDLGTLKLPVLDKAQTALYCGAVAARDFSEPLFAYARQFAQAEEILIAAPFWNYSVPAQLHVYLELVCSQGVSFDIDEQGEYVSLCRARRLTYVTTAGGLIPEPDHAWGYVRDLAQVFWRIPELAYHKAEGLDIPGADVAAALKAAMQ